MDNKIILSICIPLHNRSTVVMEHISDILGVKSNEFDIIINDSSEAGKDFVSQYGNDIDGRIKVFRENPQLTAMTNWLHALEHADGVFALHLNDRDLIESENLTSFIRFLKENQNLSGGVCKYVKNGQEAFTYSKGGDAVLNVPYFSWHPTGLFFNTEMLMRIDNRADYFSTEFNHPHDAIIGKLAVQGDMAIYTKKIWNMASDEFYKKNQSTWHAQSVSEKDYFFMPTVRINELKDFLCELDKLRIDDAIKQLKRKQMYKTYLRLATANYFYYRESRHEMEHYGMERKTYTVLYKMNFAKKITEDLCDDLNICSDQRRKLVSWVLRENFLTAMGKKMPNKFKTLLLDIRDHSSIQSKMTI